MYLAARSLDIGNSNCFAVDLSNHSRVERLLDEVQPEVIINAAAWTDVDGAEAHADQAYRLNAELPGWLAAYAASSSAMLVHYSTDYVFAGDQSQPYVETDPVSPRTVYGESKLTGEQAVTEQRAAALILRTSWVYGGPSRNFLSTIAAKLAAGEELKVVDDQLGCPTWSRDIAACTWTAVSQILPVQQAFSPVIYHLAGDEACSWYDFARKIETELAGLGCLPYDAYRKSAVSPCSTDEYPRPAARPGYSVLNSGNFAAQFGRTAGGWQSVRQCLQLWANKTCPDVKEHN